MVQENSSGNVDNEVVFDDGWVPPKQQSADNKQQSKDERPPMFMHIGPRNDPYKFRLVQKPIMFNKHFMAFKTLENSKDRRPISPAYNDAERYKDVAWSEGGWKPSQRYAAVVIDRSDSIVKIIEVGGDVYKAFETYFDAVKKSPVSKDDGPDWILTVKKIKKNKRDTMEYSCMADPTGPKPLSEKEIADVKEFLAMLLRISRAKYKSDLGWKIFYQPATPERIKELWMQLPEDRRNRPQQPKKGDWAGQAPKSVEASVTESPTQSSEQAHSEPKYEENEVSPPPADIKPEEKATDFF